MHTFALYFEIASEEEKLVRLLYAVKLVGSLLNTLSFVGVKLYP